jgi:phage/plasmid-like protein (TIGR03299 family)
MSHEIESIAFAGATPWHGLGTPLADDDLVNWQAACQKAGLDWQVESVPLITADDRRDRVSHVAVRRTTDNKVLGVVGPRYSVLQNSSAFSWFQPFLDGGEAKLETAGSLRGGSRIWVLAKLQRDPLVIAPGDEVEKYILLSHSHDGSLAVRAGYTPQRVVCSNTLAMAHGSDASRLIRIRHTGDVLGNLMAVREVMDLADQEFVATATQYRRLARAPINQADLRKYVRRALRVDEDADTSTRMNNIVEQVVGLAESGRGNDLPSIRGTYWSAYNGVTEYLGYNRGRTPDNRLNSLWYGDGASLNRHALDVALDMAA